MGFITKLQAINQMLLAAGESPVADLIESSGIDTGIANTILEQASLDFQMRGLANNKILRKLTPDSSGKILFETGDSDEEGIISVDLMSRHLNDDGIVIIAKLLHDIPPRLYNYTDETDIWKSTETYYVEVIKKVAWEHLDTNIQRAVMATAMRQYQIAVQGDGEADRYLQYNEQLYGLKGRASDIHQKKRNIFRTGDLNTIRAALRNPYIYNPNRIRNWEGLI
jgi:hypothetical protein